MNTVRRAVPSGTARQVQSASDLDAGNRLIGPPAIGPAAFSGGKFCPSPLKGSQRACHICGPRRHAAHRACFASGGSAPNHNCRGLGRRHPHQRVRIPTAFNRSAPGITPSSVHRRSDIRSLASRRSCVPSSGRSSRSSTGTGFPRSGTADRGRSAGNGGCR